MGPGYDGVNWDEALHEMTLLINIHLGCRFEPDPSRAAMRGQLHPGRRAFLIFALGCGDRWVAAGCSLGYRKLAKRKRAPLREAAHHLSSQSE